VSDIRKTELSEIRELAQKTGGTLVRGDGMHFCANGGASFLVLTLFNRRAGGRVVVALFS